MKIKKRIYIPIIVIILAMIVFTAMKSKARTQTTYTFAEITRGNIENTVNATGTIEPVTQVEVGTQVSGIIDKLLVDFNDKVKKNQLLAVIDTTILSVQVRDAQASVLRSQAQYDQAKYNYERTEKLYQQNLLSELEYVTAKSNYQSALSSLQSSQNSLERNAQNMCYAFIRSPIEGTVIYREVEEGQTVASSFQTPRLFLIAEDLSKMEIHALVDESEIGLIEEGQPVRFDVQAYDDKTFAGVVRQVWLQPETVQNVVNYTVVVDADNPEGLLLPGMTATLDFIVEERNNVLLAPSSALKLQPTESMAAAVREGMRKRFGSRPDSTRRQGRDGNSAGQEGSGMGMMAMAGSMDREKTNFSMLWFFDEEEQLQMCPVRLGSTDGKNTEIFPMRGEFEAGMKIITAIETNEPAAQKMNRSPMGGGRGGFGGPRPF